MTEPTKISPNVLSWASLLDDATRSQALSLGELPFIHPHVALMPDAHAGLGSAVGTVIPTVGVVIPAAVGVDIGCGMIAARTRYTAADFEGRDLTRLRDALEHVIPLSPGNYNTRTTRFPFTAPRLRELESLAAPGGAEAIGRPDLGYPGASDPGVDLSHSPKWKVQLGSLGGGNHFIELCLDERDRAWMFLHSGSRGVGNKIARVHIREAKEQCKREGVKLAHPDHAHLREGTPQFARYIRELRWAQHFALLNREDMMDRFAWALADFKGDGAAGGGVGEVERINTHHNYTEHASIDGLDVWLTRKGAIDASEGRPGLIPGSMGARSYVVEGLGDDLALRSAPHGAGRTLSRTAAKKRYTAADLDEAMGDIVYRPGKAWVDEIPAAYKPIDVVMRDAESLVAIRHTLRQILNVKGT
ncbi:MAG TPA: RtcB family protein [Corynebacterium xerosis]|uniref:RtcB family protein n=1 Tax=Corynebacterium xerosis TaxID=1725 RepID=UPI001E1043F4|nr:RtcB family protein [Corynebacterium xerosis]HJG57681.1 RtcB family protein [Corynebacterium xerosis]